MHFVDYLKKVLQGFKKLRIFVSTKTNNNTKSKIMTTLTTLSLNDMVTEALTNLEEINFGRGSAYVDFGKKQFYVTMEIKPRRNYKNEIEKGFFLVSIEVEGVKIMDEITQYLSNTSATRIGIISAIETEMKFQNKN